MNRYFIVLQTQDCDEAKLFVVYENGKVEKLLEGDDYHDSILTQIEGYLKGYHRALAKKFNVVTITLDEYVYMHEWKNEEDFKIVREYMEKYPFKNPDVVDLGNGWTKQKVEYRFTYDRYGRINGKEPYPPC